MKTRQQNYFVFICHCRLVFVFLSVIFLFNICIVRVFVNMLHKQIHFFVLNIYLFLTKTNFNWNLLRHFYRYYFLFVAFFCSFLYMSLLITLRTSDLWKYRHVWHALFYYIIKVKQSYTEKNCNIM